MKTNHATIEHLEGRQLLSAAPGVAGHHVGADKPLFANNSAVVFQGTAVNLKGKVMATLQMTVTKSGNGFSDQVIVTDSGGATDLTLSMNAAGQFSYHGTAGGLLSVAGQMNAADTVITGFWTHTSTNENTHGTIRLAVVSTTPITPTTPTVPTTPTQPTNTTVSVSNYAGIATDAKNETSQITFAITDTKSARTGVLNILDTNHATPLAFSITSSLTFSFSFTETNEVDTVSGKISADGKTITGGWTSFHADGGTGSGTFTATRT